MAGDQWSPLRVLTVVRREIGGFSGVGKIWDDKYGKVWYNSIIQKRTTKDLLEASHRVIPLGMTGVEVENRSFYICTGGYR